MHEMRNRNPEEAKEITERMFDVFQPLRTLISEYLSEATPRQPLSIAIFGPWGVGKSFFTNRLAMEVEPRGVLAMTLDLHRLQGPSDLTVAFNSILREVEAGLTPFVIVEGFDGRSDAGGWWLPYFLGPMQGQLWDGKAWQELNRGIFAFVGASAPTLEAFLREVEPIETKAADFVARLRGYLNISVPESTARFRNVCKIIVPEFEAIDKEMLEYFAAKPDALQDLEWRKFEELLEAVFRNQGFETILGPGRGDEGVDLRLLQKDSIGAITTLVQAKRYAKRPIELQAVQALSAAVNIEHANRGLFVTTSRYLPVAKRFAARQHTKIHLATSEDVARWCEEASRLWPRLEGK